MKRYGCLFTCLTVRAIHIEVVLSLDVSSFLNALERFICRRGKPEIIRSDNATNFVAGQKELKAAIADWNSRKIEEFLRQKCILWKFNPPAASHMGGGGVWERQIRSVRNVLRFVLKEKTLDDESLATVMCEIEAIINGRPITVVSDDAKDLNPPPPNHLLLLRSGAYLPPGVFYKDDNYSRKRWRQVQYLSDLFWKRWTKEYLPSLQKRTKWLRPSMVENSPRNMWPIGRVIETYADKDGFVRSAKIKVRSSYLVRPIHKLCLLESVN